MWSLVLTLLLVTNAHAQKKGGANVNIYEQEADSEQTKSFTAKVRVVREISDEVEVFFEGEKATGAYTLPHSSKGYATMLKDLEASKKPGGASVAVSADSEKRIKSVQLQKSADYEFPPANSKEKWDFEKAAESIKKKSP